MSGTLAWGLGPRNQVLRPVIQALKERRTFQSWFFSFAPLGLASCVVLRFPGVLTPGYYPRPLRGRLGVRSTVLRQRSAVNRSVVVSGRADR